MKLPAVEEEKIERIIAFEGQQNVPFSIDEVVWDYQLVGAGASAHFLPQSSRLIVRNTADNLWLG